MMSRDRLGSAGDNSRALLVANAPPENPTISRSRRSLRQLFTGAIHKGPMTARGFKRFVVVLSPSMPPRPQQYATLLGVVPQV